MNFRVFDKFESTPLPSGRGIETWPLRRSASSLATEDYIFVRPAEAQVLVEQLYRLPIGAIAIDTEYRYSSSAVPLNGGGTWYDPTDPAP